MSEQTNSIRAIHSTAAPEAIGPYSHATCTNNLVYISGQIPLCPNSMELVAGGIKAQTEQVFKNLQAVAEAAGGSLKNTLKLNIFLTDLNDFPAVNQIMARHFNEPYPARACVGVNSLPKGAAIEADAILAL